MSSSRSPLIADPTAFVTDQVDAGNIHITGTGPEHALLEPLGMGALVHGF